MSLFTYDRCRNKDLERYKNTKAEFQPNFYSASSNSAWKTGVSKTLFLNYMLSKLDNCIWEEKKKRGRERVDKEQRNAI